MRKGARKDAQENSRSYLEKPLSGTAEERQAAVEAFSEVAPEIKSAVHNYLCECISPKVNELVTDGYSKAKKDKGMDIGIKSSSELTVYMMKINP